MTQQDDSELFHSLKLNEKFSFNNFLRVKWELNIYFGLDETPKSTCEDARLSN